MRKDIHKKYEHWRESNRKGWEGKRRGGYLLALMCWYQSMLKSLLKFRKHFLMWFFWTLSVALPFIVARQMDKVSISAKPLSFSISTYILFHNCIASSLNTSWLLKNADSHLNICLEVCNTVYCAYTYILPSKYVMAIKSWSSGSSFWQRRASSSSP